MRRALRSGPRREVLVVATWAALFAVLLVLRVVLQRSDASPGAPLGWLRHRRGAALLVLLVSAAALGGVGHRCVGRVVLRVEQAAVFIAITRLLGLGAQPDPGRAEQLLIALLGLHAVGAIVVSDELSERDAGLANGAVDPGP